MNLTTENLRTTERILKNAYRAVRAASLSGSGGVEPISSNYLVRPTGTLDVSTIRYLMGLANHPQGAAAIVAYFMDDYIQ